MLIAIDAGNTNAKIALFDNNGIVIQKSIIPIKNKIKFPGPLKTFLTNNSNFTHCIVSSVVPEINSQITTFFIKNYKVNPIFISNQNTKCLNFIYEKPEMIGADRIANVLAALSVFKTPALVCDFGTATTFSIALKQDEFSGGLIAPGVKTSFESLNRSTSKLPKVNAEGNSPLIGKSTYECIRSGIMHMQHGYIEKVINSIKTEYPSIKTICTGGFAKLFLDYFDSYHENLVLTGCYEFFKRCVNN